MTALHSVLNMPEYPWQSSEYILGPKYARILNMGGILNMQDLCSVLNIPQSG